MDQRGQTTLDFAFGISIFLLVTAFVFLFVPSMLDPFAGTDQSDRVVADRIVTQLATETLVITPSNPYILNDTCTDAFFNGVSPVDCRFEGSTLNERLGLSNLIQIQASIEGKGIVKRSVGETPPNSSSSVFVAMRAVQYRDKNATLTVKVW